MRSALLFVLALSPLVAQQVVPLRPGVTRDPSLPPERTEQRGKDGVNDRAIMDVSEPTLTVYLPSKEKATGAGILVCPGGGYVRLAIDKEGHDVARWLSSQGIAAFVLKYRLPGSQNMKLSLGTFDQAREAARVAVEDASDAMLLIRRKSAEWNVRADAVGMMGFSAGGHLTSMLGMSAPANSRPNFLALIYPAVPKELRVDAATPRTFLVHADDDGLSSGDHSVRFYLALKQAKVNAEMHVYSGGGHGFGIRKSEKTAANWPAAFESWFAKNIKAGQ